MVRLQPLLIFYIFIISKQANKTLIFSPDQSNKASIWWCGIRWCKIQSGSPDILCCCLSLAVWKAGVWCCIISKQANKTLIFSPDQSNKKLFVSFALYALFSQTQLHNNILYFTVINKYTETGRVAQWKRAGPITQRSMVQIQLLPNFYYLKDYRRGFLEKCKFYLTVISLVIKEFILCK